MLVLLQTITDQRLHICVQVARLCSQIQYPKPDGVFSFDVPTSLHRFHIINLFSYSGFGWRSFFEFCRKSTVMAISRLPNWVLVLNGRTGHSTLRSPHFCIFCAHVTWDVEHSLLPCIFLAEIESLFSMVRCTGHSTLRSPLFCIFCSHVTWDVERSLLPCIFLTEIKIVLPDSDLASSDQEHYLLEHGQEGQP